MARRSMLPLLMMAPLLASGSVSPEAQARWEEEERPRLVRARLNQLLEQGVLSCPCSRCGAAPGVPCNRQTLGKHRWHKARLDAWETKRAAILDAAAGMEGGEE